MFYSMRKVIDYYIGIISEYNDYILTHNTVKEINIFTAKLT